MWMGGSFNKTIQGKIAYENYFVALKPEGVHSAMSVSKSFTGILGVLLLAQGLLDESKTAADYVPELKNSAFGDSIHQCPWFLFKSFRTFSLPNKGDIVFENPLF